MSNFQNPSLVLILNNELKNIKNLAISNRLISNVSKITAIIFSNKSVPSLENSVEVCSQCIETLNSCKFLSVHIDSKLPFKTHIHLIMNKISRNADIFYKIRINLSMKARINFYSIFIYPYLIYNIITFGSTYDIASKRII